MKPSVAVVIFAKYPEPGRVKTRLALSSQQQGRELSLEQVAALYRAFLLDYVERFSQTTAEWEVFFCLRADAKFDEFCGEIAQHRVDVLAEPEYAGRSAVSIGESMGFTIRFLLLRGFAKVLILGSDLPHLPFSVLREAVCLLDKHTLVLGNDGGGCYLVGASDIPVAIEDPSIVWSQGVDFEIISRIQHGLQKSMGVLSEVWQDIDQIEDLYQLCRDLQQEKIPLDRIPHTVDCLRGWGYL